jgi:hypothetical protein
MVLSDYITQVRRLLKDAESNFFSNEELTDYINEARNRVAQDTVCLRTLQAGSLVANQETYSFSSFPLGSRTIDVLNVNFINGNQRIDLKWLPWTKFNASGYGGSGLRQFENFVGLPAIVSKYNQNTVYVSPIPDQTYVAEWDTVVLPVPLVNDSTVEEILAPYTEPVKYYAAYLAKYNQQSFGEADLFQTQYANSVRQVIRSTAMRRIYTTIFDY